MTFIDSPLQPEYELSKSLHGPLSNGMNGIRHEFQNFVTDYHFSQLTNEFYNIIIPMPCNLKWASVRAALWTDIS